MGGERAGVRYWWKADPAEREPFLQIDALIPNIGCGAAHALGIEFTISTASAKRLGHRANSCAFELR